jgi:hypothetical protein
MNAEEIEQLEDMVKLKNAKTSTRDRLAKTIRKSTSPKPDSISQSPTRPNSKTCASASSGQW